MPALTTIMVISPGRATGSNWNSHCMNKFSIHQRTCSDVRASSNSHSTWMNNSRQPPRIRGMTIKLTHGTASIFANRLNIGICW